MSELRQIDLQVLLRAFQSGAFTFRSTTAGRRFVEESGFGKIRGANWIWDASDRAHVREYLVKVWNIADPDTYRLDFTDQTRIETAAKLSQEKFSGRGPREGRVLIRGIHGSVQINGVVSRTIEDSCLDLDADVITSIEHDCLVVIENFEAVTAFERLVLQGFPFHDPLLLFRGDAINSLNGAKTLATNATVPVVAFADVDPHGLNISNSTPNFVGVILPVTYEHFDRDDLFINQRRLLGPMSKYPAGWHPVISAMLNARRCVTQEQIIARRVPCIYLPN